MGKNSKEITKIRIIESVSADPWYNLALEEYLLNKVVEGEVILYLWQNNDTVVIGRNQNAWKECRCKQLEDDGGKLARRLSGGGAVFHDLGNLNFTFLMDKTYYNLDRQLGVILQAVRSLGIKAEFSGRNDLICQNKKFSGNAFYFTDKAAYHHGTILINSDFSKLLRYLQVSREKIESKGIDSVRSRVINLKEVAGSLDITKMKDALRAAFLDSYLPDKLDIPELEIIDPRTETGSTIRSSDQNKSDIKQQNSDFEQTKLEIDHAAMPFLVKKYSSWEWLYGNTPQFDIRYQQRFSWGGIEIAFSLKNGQIEEAVIYSDTMEAELIKKLAQSFTGIPFLLTEIVNKIEEFEKNIRQELWADNNEYQDIDLADNYQIILADLKEWLKTRDW